ncbi:HU family DNA-binding protein [Porphyromonas sp.]
MLQYHLIKQTSKVGKNKGKTIYRAQSVTRGKVSFDAFCREVSDGSTVDVADVKAVLSRLHTVITRNLERGFSVEVGELGTFRPSFGSVEVLEEKEFDVLKHIRKPRVLFHPRVAFASSLQGVHYERINLDDAKVGEYLRPKKKPEGTPDAPHTSEGTGGHATDGHVGV